MMIYKAFSNQGFLRQETLKVVSLLAANVPIPEIQRQILIDDLFEVRAQDSRKTLASAILQRLEGMDVTYLVDTSLEMQRFTVLLLIARQHRLLAELLQELGLWARSANALTRGQLERFFAQKRETDLTLASWSEATFKKSCSNCVHYLVQAKLLTADLSILRPVLSQSERQILLTTFGTWGLRMLLEDA